jgi:raffinose/stachyose/melibiose transport system permease protein
MTFGGVIVNLLLCLFSFTCVYPIFWMLYSSLKSQKQFAVDSIGLPTELHFENYIQAITEGKLNVYFFNSLVNTVTTVFVSIILAYFIGYCLSRFKFRGRNLLYYFFLSGMLIPIYALLIPIFLEFSKLHLINKRISLIIPYIAFAMPIAVFLIESFVKGIPFDLEESACIDGSSFLRTTFYIIMPLCQPILATIIILSFLGAWNEFPLALVLISSNRLKTIPIGLTNFVGSYTTDYTLMFAAMVIATLPIIIVYLLFFNKIMEGMVNGAVKG